jgi:hypothetical protein
VRPSVPVLLAAVALVGCGSAAAPPAPKPILPRQAHIRVVPKSTFVHRVNRICGHLDRVDIGAAPTPTSDIYRNRRVFGTWFGRAHKAIRHARGRLTQLGEPSHDRARWQRVMNKLRAIESHVDTMRAAAWSGSMNMLVLSARELQSSAKSIDRRFRRFGAGRCADSL